MTRQPHCKEVHLFDGVKIMVACAVSFSIGDGLLGILQDLAAERTARHGR
jgi:hypothetical protein